MRILGYITGVFVAMIILALLSAIPIYLLWNCLMPIIFHLPVVTFWQALGISFLSSILFKSSNSTSTKK